MSTPNASSREKARVLTEARQYLQEVKIRQAQKIEPDEEFIQRGLQILRVGNSRIKDTEDVIRFLEGKVGSLTQKVQTKLPIATNGFRSSLDDRIALAQSQGFILTKNGARPTKKSTIQAKLEEWEKGYEEGLNFTDFSSLTESDFDTRPKSFISGVCEAMEKTLGVEKPSQYLRPRFRTLLQKLA